MAPKCYVIVFANGESPARRILPLLTRRWSLGDELPPAAPAIA